MENSQPVDKSHTETLKSSTVNDEILASKNKVSIMEEDNLSPLKRYSKKNIKIPDWPEITSDSLASQINVLFMEDALDMQTISQVLEKSVELSKKKYVILTLENRKSIIVYEFY